MKKYSKKMIKAMIVRLAHLLFAVSSWIKAIGKFILPKSIVCDCLSLPGWFILDDVIIHQSSIEGKLIGFQWEYWLMPDPWISEMNKLKGQLK